MIVDRREKVLLTGCLSGLEVVNDFIYLGSLISDKGSSQKEIKRRIMLGRVAMKKLTKIWQSRSITNNTKIRLVESLVFSVLLYGCETWTVNASDKKRSEAFEMWCWRRMLRVSWMERRTNASIMEELKVPNRLSTLVNKRMLQFFGHVVRRNVENLEKIIM